MSDICKWYIAILIYSARSIKQHSAGRHVAPLGQVIIPWFCNVQISKNLWEDYT
jgi:hypothetical protein